MIKLIWEYQMVNLLRKITIYHNLENITDESLEIQSKKFNMILYRLGQSDPIPFKLTLFTKNIRRLIARHYIRDIMNWAAVTVGKKWTKVSIRTLECGKRYFQYTLAEPFYIMLLNEKELLAQKGAKVVSVQQDNKL